VLRAKWQNDSSYGKVVRGGISYVGEVDLCLVEGKSQLKKRAQGLLGRGGDAKPETEEGNENLVHGGR
jgi:hypothetical protein